MRWKALSLMLALALAACCKEQPTSPETPVEEPCYEKFLGSYNVTDLQTNEEYGMTISHFASLNNFDVKVDTLIMTNFDNRFDVKFGFGCYESPSQNHLGWQFHFGIEDYSGLHWALFYNGVDTIDGKQINTLIGDTIYFSMDKTNIAFYLDEGVPFEECQQCVLKAVKQ